MNKDIDYYKVMKVITFDNIICRHTTTQNGIIHGLTWKTIMGVIINLQYRDNIKVLYSQDPKTTVYLLNMIYQKIEGDKIYEIGVIISKMLNTHSLGII